MSKLLPKWRLFQIELEREYEYQARLTQEMQKELAKIDKLDTLIEKTANPMKSVLQKKRKELIEYIKLKYIEPEHRDMTPQEVLDALPTGEDW